MLLYVHIGQCLHYIQGDEIYLIMLVCEQYTYMSRFANNALLGGGVRVRVRVRVGIREQRKNKRRSKALLSL